MLQAGARCFEDDGQILQSPSLWVLSLYRSRDEVGAYRLALDPAFDYYKLICTSYVSRAIYNAFRYSSLGFDEC